MLYLTILHDTKRCYARNEASTYSDTKHMFVNMISSGSLFRSTLKQFVERCGRGDRYHTTIEHHVKSLEHKSKQQFAYRPTIAKYKSSILNARRNH